ncbi:DUF3034 family protein [Pleionea sediminis]|uniref:DUF3034 family protein n=1 Tax=Pleionea sediminis TaxID=2569479 RepID=UPI0011869275|nr:DUF3034 family protein [Pleionea sediminis]
MSKYIFLFTILFLNINSLYSKGKLIAAPGVSQIEGSAGGGLVPWSGVAGYATDNEYSANAFCSRAIVEDFALTSCGIQFSAYDQIELSYAKQLFRVHPLALDLEQNITGAKIKLTGDLIYSKWPMLSLGVQFKKLDDPTVPFALGAAKRSGTDFYIAASKLHLGALGGYNWLWNTTLRRTKANEMGLLGFGSGTKEAKWMAEISTAIILDPELALGIEFREKPDNLQLDESNWSDIFIAWFPNKNVSATLAYVDLGKIATIKGQTGWYMSFTGYW